MSDPRFARLRSDPRFRRPRKEKSKVVIDDRFKSVFAPEKKKKDKAKSGRVDKYGRPVSDSQDQENLRRFYRLENEDEPDQSQPTAPDYARGQVLLESSDEDEQGDANFQEDEDSDTGGFVTIGGEASRPIRIADHEKAEVDLDESRFDDLDAQAAAYNASHPEPVSAPDVSRTHRLAVVNLDWDHVRATHLYKICSSLVSPTAPAAASSSSKSSSSERRQRSGKGGSSTVARGRVLSVRIYPSQFGKERLAREEKEGPPPEIFKRKQADEDEEVTERNIIEVADENDFDDDALRKYQLDRLKYYYAVLTCDTVDAASHIYDELEGTELERSANVFELSFVPDDMTFDEEFRDEATEDMGGEYKGVEFVTDALRHSKVKLTWDDDDPTRNQMTRRRITRKEMEETDFRAYLASSSSESESENETKQKTASRDKLRSLLLGGDNELPEGWNRDGDGAGKDTGDGDGDVDMEVTFMPGLTATNEDKEETTLDKYQRKMKEKRKKKKEESQKTQTTEKETEETDDFFAAASDEDEPRTTKKAVKKSSSSKEASTADDLSLLVASSNNAEPQHFDLKSVMKAEKMKGKKKFKKGKKEDETELQEDFAINVNDDRFNVLHENHDFAIDPSNPHFKKTKAMQALLDARSKKKTESGADARDGSGGQSLQNLVESVKRKSTSSAAPLAGKRRKL